MTKKANVISTECISIQFFFLSPRHNIRTTKPGHAMSILPHQREKSVSWPDPENQLVILNGAFPIRVNQIAEIKTALLSKRTKTGE